MSKLIRLGDSSDHGGTMVTASGKFKSGGVQACLDGDLHQCGNSDHGTTPVTSTATAKSDGKGILRGGDRAGCGALLSSSSKNVTVK